MFLKFHVSPIIKGPGNDRYEIDSLWSRKIITQMRKFELSKNSNFAMPGLTIFYSFLDYKLWITHSFI